jgi:hypothetical protein
LRKQLYDHYLTEAKRWVEKLENQAAEPLDKLDGELGELQFFSLPVDATHQH